MSHWFSVFSSCLFWNKNKVKDFACFSETVKTLNVLIPTLFCHRCIRILFRFPFSICLSLVDFLQWWLCRSVLRIRISLMLILILLFTLGADPDQTFHFDVDPVRCFHFDAVPYPTFNFDADPDPFFHFDADPNPVDANMRPLVYRPSMALFWASSTVTRLRPSFAPFWVSKSHLWHVNLRGFFWCG